MPSRARLQFCADQIFTIDVTPYATSGSAIRVRLYHRGQTLNIH